MTNNDIVKMVRCCKCPPYCPSVAQKVRLEEGAYITQDFIERGEEGYDYIIYRNGNSKNISDGYCVDHYYDLLDEIELSLEERRRAREAKELTERVEERR